MKNVITFISLFIITLLNCLSQNLYKYILKKDSICIDSFSNYNQKDLIIYKGEYRASNLFIKIDYEYYIDNSFAILVYYQDYCLTIARLKDTFQNTKINYITSNIGNSNNIEDSVEVISVGNVEITIDYKTKHLLQFIRFKTDTDSIDYNAFKLDLTISKGIEVDCFFPTQWFENGVIKKSVLIQNNYYLYFSYNRNSTIEEIIVYQLVKDQEDVIDFYLIKSIKF